jgi:3-oxoacyl-[acyl-carrier protein] reductase
MSLKGKVTMVTGASGGIGREIARILAEDGSDLVLLDRKIPALDEVRDACAGKGVRAEAVPIDLSDPAEAERALSEALRGIPRVDHLVNNAGITRDSLLMRMKREDWDAVLAVNLTAVFLITRAVVPSMLKARYGRIVNIASVVGMMGNPGQANYCASKAGIIGFTLSLARELASRNITVNAVAPGFIDTAMTAAMTPAAREALLSQVPLGRMGVPTDVAEGVRFLLGEGASYITGTVLNISGGLHME